MRLAQFSPPSPGAPQLPDSTPIAVPPPVQAPVPPSGPTDTAPLPEQPFARGLESIEPEREPEPERDPAPDPAPVGVPVDGTPHLSRTGLLIATAAALVVATVVGIFVLRPLTSTSGATNAVGRAAATVTVTSTAARTTAAVAASTPLPSTAASTPASAPSLTPAPTLPAPPPTTARSAPPAPAASPATGCATQRYSKGSSSSCVNHLQALYNYHAKRLWGGSAIPVDGDFGPVTDAAVRSYQTHLSLVVDGIVGPQTWGALCTPPNGSSPGATVPSDFPLTRARDAGCANASSWHF